MKKIALVVLALGINIGFMSLSFSGQTDGSCPAGSDNVTKGAAPASGGSTIPVVDGEPKPKPAEGSSAE